MHVNTMENAVNLCLQHIGKKVSFLHNKFFGDYSKNASNGSDDSELFVCKMIPFKLIYKL